jgi:type II secretory pathway predicted ATPase ExeA
MKKKTRCSAPPPQSSAHAHFDLKRAPFGTRALGQTELGLFLGRETYVQRVAAALFSLQNVGVASEPGLGKSSLLQAVKARVPRGFHVVTIGVPVDDAAYFLRELLRESLLVLPPAKGLPLKEWGRRLEEEPLGKNALLSMLKNLWGKTKKPVLVFVDDLEKINGDRVAHLTRSERTLQLLEELKTLLEMPKAAFVISLQDEFHARVRDVVKDGADPTVLGLFRTVVRLEPFDVSALREMVMERLRSAGWKKEPEVFFEPEVLVLALSFSRGNPRRLMFLLAEACDRAFLRRARRVEFRDLFEAVNEHLHLDQVCRKLLYYLAKAGRAMAVNTDLQAFLRMDAVSLNRRFEVLVKNGLAERADVSEGSFVYALPGMGSVTAEAPPVERLPERTVKFKDEKMWLLDSEP